MADLDLTALKEALAKMTPGVWDLDTGFDIVGGDCAQVATTFADALVFRAESECQDNAAGIVLLHNSADAMIARIEALEAENARLLQSFRDIKVLVTEAIDLERIGCIVALDAINDLSIAALATKGEK